MDEDIDVKKRFKIPTYVFNRYHINLWSGDCFNRRKKYYPAIKQYKAGELNANSDREMVPIYEGRSRAYLHILNLKATEKDVREGLQLQPNNTNLLLTLADCYYQKDQFEDALGAYCRGHYKRSKPPKFVDGILASTGTILNTLGSKVGNIMSKKRLGDVVVQMKKQETGVKNVKKPHNEIARRRKIEKIKRFKEIYNQLYLEDAAEEEKLLESCLNSNYSTLFLGNKKHNEIIRKALDDAVSKIKAAKEALWRREPLYTREQDVLSKRLKQFIAKKQELKTADLEIIVNLRIAAFDQAFTQKKYVQCFKLGDELRTFLFAQSERDLPSKKDSMTTVISILGDLFLQNKKFLAKSAEENDERLLVIFGFREPKTLIEEIYSDEAFHPKIRGVNDFLKSKLADLEHTKDHLEKAYLNHEIGVSYSFKNFPFLTKKYAREAIFASKAAKDRKWLLNSMFLLARSEIQQGNKHLGRVTLNGLMTAADKLKNPDLKFLAVRAYELTFAEDFGPPSMESDDIETKIIKAMSNNEYLITAMKYLQKARKSRPGEGFPAIQDTREVSQTVRDEEHNYYATMTESSRRATLNIDLELF